MADKFEDLRTYVAIIESGGVSAAAAKLGIAKSAVSRRLADLERRLSTSLVDRTTRRLQLTGSGRILLREGQRLLADLAELEESIAGSASGSTTISIAAEPLLARHLLAKALASFTSIHPRTRIDLLDGSEAPSSDVAVITGNGPDGHVLARTSRVVVAAPGYLADRDGLERLADLAGHRGIAVESAGARDWRFSGDMVARPEIAVSVPDCETGLAYAIAGAGLVQLPDYACRLAIFEGRLVSVLRAYEPEGVNVVARPVRQPTDEIDQLIGHLKSALGGGRPTAGAR